MRWLEQTTALGQELLNVEPTDPCVNDGVMVDDSAGVLVSFAGTVG